MEDLQTRFSFLMEKTVFRFTSTPYKSPQYLVLTICFVVSVPLAFYNYRAYVALGRSGLPTFPGWILATVMKPFGGETLSTSQYDRDTNPRRWLQETDIPLRTGQRPKTGFHFLPNRQIEQFPPEEIKRRIVEEFRKIGEDNSRLVEFAVSPHERLGQALVIRSSRPTPHKVADDAWREIAHVHGVKDHSMHVVLSPLDCKLVIEREWGERHPLSGRIGLPKEYLLIYAPRTEEEVRVAGKIMRAAVGFMTSSDQVR